MAGVLGSYSGQCGRCGPCSMRCVVLTRAGAADAPVWPVRGLYTPVYDCSFGSSFWLPVRLLSVLVYFEFFFWEAQPHPQRLVV